MKQTLFLLGILMLKNNMFAMEIAPHGGPEPLEIEHNHFPKREILGFNVKDLSQLAPIAISMYCFNHLPRFTMTTLTLMLLYVISSNETFKSKIKQIRKKIAQLYKSLKINFKQHYHYSNKIDRPDVGKDR